LLSSSHPFRRQAFFEIINKPKTECLHFKVAIWFESEKKSPGGIFFGKIARTQKYFDNIRLNGYIQTMKTEARLFKSLADETRLQILWLLMDQEELCVCDIMRTLGITQSKASRHLRYLFNVGLVTDRREGVWMNYRLALPPGSNREGFIKLLGEMLAASPGARGLRDKLQEWLKAKAAAGQEGSCVCS
jgi:ArsR family transcriptional regulator